MQARREENRRLASQFLSRIEKQILNESNPVTIKRILKELKLDTFSTRDDNFQWFLIKVRNTPTDLTKLIKAVSTNLLNSQPICLLLASIQKDNLISDEEIEKSIDTLNFQINLLCLFEAFTVTMANSQTFAEDVYEHIIKNRGSSASGNPLVNFFQGAPLNAAMFERLKLISIDPGMAWISFHRSMAAKQETEADVKDFIKKYKLSGWNATGIKPAEIGRKSEDSISSMAINILEASWSDLTGSYHQFGGKDNAATGTALIYIMEHKKYLAHFELASTVLPERTRIQENGYYELLPDLLISRHSKKISYFDLTPEWRDLYNSWNLRFVIPNPKLDSIFLPIKLLLPSVFSAESEKYYETRLLSLFLMGNIFLQARVKNNPLFVKQHINLKNKNQILLLWGKVNEDYAARLLKKYFPESTITPEQIRQYVFRNHPHMNFMYYLTSCAYDLTNFRVTQNLHLNIEDTTPKMSMRHHD